MRQAKVSEICSYGQAGGQVPEEAGPGAPQVPAGARGRQQVHILSFLLFLSLRTGILSGVFSCVAVPKPEAP